MGEIASYPLSVWQKGPQPATPVSCRTDVSPHLHVDKAVGSVIQKVPTIHQGTGSVKMKRGHVSKACTNCRKMHAGCDLARPCSRCVFHRMESSCVDIPRKKRVSKKKQPGEQGLPEVTTAIVVDTKKDALRHLPSVGPTGARTFKDPYSDLFDSFQLPGPLPSPSASLPVSLNPNTTYFPTLADIVGSDSDSHSSLPHSPSSSTGDFVPEETPLFSPTVASQPRKDVVELKEQMDELRQSNVNLEGRLNNVTQELIEMRQKMQQMLHLLGGFFTSPSPNDNDNLSSSSDSSSSSADGTLLGVPLSQDLSDL